MFSRRRTPAADGPAIGIGVVVDVLSPAGESDAFVGEPGGVVVERAGQMWGLQPGISLSPRWVVAFFEPARLQDGRVLEQFELPERRLRPSGEQAALVADEVPSELR